MKKYAILFLWAVAGVLCSCTDDAAGVVQGEPACEQTDAQPFSQLVVEQVKQMVVHKQQVGYFLYNAQEDKWSFFEEAEYQALWACAQLIVRDAEVQTRGGEPAPRWNTGGQGSSAIDVMTIVSRLKSEIPKGRSFEIKVVYGADGKTFTVYWRLI